MRLTRFIEEASKITKALAAFDLLARWAREQGFPWVAYGSLTDHDKVTLETPGYPAVMLNYPEKWQGRYFRKSYADVDPVLSRSRHESFAFNWRSVREQRELGVKQRRVFDEAAGFGLSEGATVPLHGPNGGLAVLSFATDEKNEIRSDRLSLLQAAAAQFHFVAIRCGVYAPEDGGLTPLSEREAECVCWSARGKSSWEIGAILGISENTVNFHIKNAMRKLRTSNRIVAVVKALRLGWIKP